MEEDPEYLFRDDDDGDDEFYQPKEVTKEVAVYLIDASPKMFQSGAKCEDEKEATCFHIAVSCVAQALKTQIINRSYDEIAICFFNTRDKKNLQDSDSVYVFSVADREDLDRPTVLLIKEFNNIKETFERRIGSKYGIVSGRRENSLYNALWVAQALLRKGSAKTTDKRILLFTNEDDPFGNIGGLAKADMTRTTIQRAKDAQDLGISIELLPLSGADEEFNVSLFYADMIGLEDNDLSEFVPLTGDRFQDLTGQLRKRMFKKRKIKRIMFSLLNGISIEVNAYALLRPSVPGAITWLDSVTNLPVKFERSYICTDTGALLQEPCKRFYPYKNQHVLFSVDELSEVKRISTSNLQLLGFKPMSCLKDYHNIRPSTFLYPSDEEIAGSTCVFIALHRAMLQLKRFAVAFYSGSAQSHLVALVAQEEISNSGCQIEPPGLHMIYLPYSDDIRHPEELHATDSTIFQATNEQIEKAIALMKCVDLKFFSVSQFANPALQRHYAVLEALALGETDMVDTMDETLPDEEGMARQRVVDAVTALKLSVIGDDDHDVSEKGADPSKKRKVMVADSIREYYKYDWNRLADSGMLKDLTVAELKYYLSVNNLPLTGKKADLISRILSHLCK